VARPDLSEALRGGLLGVAVGEALGLAWLGCAPREIKRARLLEGVGPTGALTAAALAAADGVALEPACALIGGLIAGWAEPDRLARRAAAHPLGLGAIVVADLAAQALDGRAVYQQVNDHGKDWPPPFRGVAATDRAVISALLANLHRHDDPNEGMQAAVRLGGDGVATLTALVGGIFGVRRPTAITRVPWLARTAVPEDAALDVAVAALVARRQP
jgi:hypothetical protein